MNTTKEGKIRFLIFKKEKRGKLFTGVCLDFGIVLQDKSPLKLKEELEKAAFCYLRVVIKKKMSEELLNNQAEKKYFNLYNRLLKRELEVINKPNQMDRDGDNSVYLIPIKQLMNCYA